ncbi:MAG: alpha-N-arabinofuranosidase [Treponema sp.]|nr:alpha-N-arabinofuranosidase [Treponema sp.]
MNEKIIVDTLDKKQTISPDIYGHFSEHLGRCIYGGFWVGKDSKIPNVNGYNKAVVQAFKDIDIPNLRWPGGCFADEYHWKDGIGPYATRKRMINTNWGGVIEDNSFGTHEFMGLCEELNCKPYICGNVGSGSVQEMDEWIEYITFDGESPMARLRKENGHEKAWKLDYFGVGNENWGCGGNMRAEFYADNYRRYQTFVRQYGKDKIFKIAGGANGDDYRWTDVLLESAGNMMDGISMHYYTFEDSWANKHPATGFGKPGWYRIMKNAFHIDEIIRRHDEVMSKHDPQKRVALVVDEWGNWFECEPGTNPGFLYQQNSVCDAVVAAVHLNIFNNHSDRVRVANLAQAVNVLQSPVLTEGDKIVLTPTWHVFHAFKAHQGATLLGTSFASQSAIFHDEEQKKDFVLPGLSVSASEREAGGKTGYLVTVANSDADKSKTVEISLAGLKGKIQSAAGTIINGDRMDSINTFEKGDAVTEKTLAVKLLDGESVSIELPAHSVAAVTVTA